MDTQAAVDQIVNLDWWRLPYAGQEVFKEKTEAILAAERARVEQEAAILYKATDSIVSLPELLEEFARKIADLESRVADLEGATSRETRS